MNRGHEVGCPALRNGVPCTCWVSPPYRLDFAHGLSDGLDVARRVETQLTARIRQLEEQNRALDIEWHGLQAMADDQRKMIERLRKALEEVKWSANTVQWGIIERALATSPPSE